MAIKLKVGNLVGSFQSGALTRLANASLPIKTASQLKKVLTFSQDAMKEYDKDRIAVCEKYGKLNPKTNDYEFVNDDGEHDPAKFEAFQKEGEDLLQKELEFPVQPFSLQAFFSSHSMTANDLMVLDWLIIIEIDHASAAVN